MNSEDLHQDLNEPFVVHCRMNNPVENDPIAEKTHLLKGVLVEKLFATPSNEFLKSLKLRNFTEEKLKKISKEIGAYIYVFRVTNTNTNESWM